VVSTLLFSFLILGINFDAFLKENDFEATTKKMTHAFSRLLSHIDDIKSSLIKGIAFNQTDESLLASIELINNYQDKYHYNAILLDEEKKNIAQKLLDKVKLSFNKDIALYDKSGELIAFVVSTGDEYQLNFISYENGEKTLYQKLESQEGYSQKSYTSSDFVNYTHPQYYEPKEATDKIPITYHANNHGLYIKSHHNMHHNNTNQIIAHIEMTHLLDSKYFDRISFDLNVDIKRDTNGSKRAIDLFKDDIEKLDVIQDELHYVASGTIMTHDGEFYITLKLQKSLLQHNLMKNRYHLLVLIFGVTLVILALLHYLFKRNLAIPLEELMEQIKMIQNRDYTLATPIKSGDELETISRNIHLLASTVHAREVSLKKSQENLRYLSDHDTLTGLPNRRFFENKIEEARLYADGCDTPFALLFIDVDHFKEINDTLGHPIGDILLQQITKRLSQFITDENMVARIGGDEFIILVYNYEHDKLNKTLEEIIQKFNQPLECMEYKIIITLSIGVAIYPHDATDNITLLQYADLALGLQKERGGNGSLYFGDEMAKEYHQRISILRQLKDSVNDFSGFYLLYQPKISITTKKIIAVEALVRWNSPQNGLVNPDQFITYAEESGLIVPLGKWIMYQAFSDFVKIQQEHPTLKYIGINISIVQILHDNIPNTIQEAINLTGIAPQSIEIEITESYMATKDLRIREILEKIRQMDIKLSIDDFGTGYSSLNYLHKLPVTGLKIDKTFIDNLPFSVESISVIEAIIALSRAFKLSVTAEGVENIKQVEFLEAIGCDEIQGYYYSKPLTFIELQKYIENSLSE